MRKNITVISGHYGSGKSEIAVNLSVQKNINILIDLDIVNPYFRSREAEKILKEHDVEAVSSPLGNLTNSDLPYLSARMYAPFYNLKIKAIYDLGGDNVGAKVFRQFSDFDLTDVDHLLVINVYREETENKDKIIKMIKSIEGSSGLKIKGLINNTNLLKETKKEDIYYGQDIILEVSKELNLDIVYTCVSKEITVDDSKILGELIMLKLYLRQEWL